MTTSHFALYSPPPVEAAFSITSADHAGVAVLGVRGDLDQLTASRLAEAVDTAVTAPLSGLVIDLDQTCFLGSAGMAVLVAAREKIERISGRYAVVASGPSTARPLRMVGLATEIAMYADLETAVQAARGAPCAPSSRAAT